MALAAAAAMLVWRCWPATAWRLAVEASDGDVTPWESVELTAALTPPRAARQPVRWTWTADGASFSTEGPTAEWRSGAVGTHWIDVAATAADGTTHHATVEVAVRARFYVTASGTHAPAPLVAAPTQTTLPFRIADLWVEKKRICQGEPTRVRLTAEDTRGQEKWLRPAIDGQQAWEITYVPALVPPGLHRIHASVVDDSLGRSLVETDAYVEVEDCIVSYPVFVQTRHVPPEPDRIALVAAVVRGRDWQVWAHRRADDASPLPRADVAHYRWDFGDGTTATTVAPRVDHLYPDEASRGTERATAYRVTVDALDEGGQTMGTGYAAVTLLNAYRDLERTAHTLQLVATVPPGPAGTGQDGSRRVAVTLRNLDPGETAHLDSLRLRFVGCDGQRSSERTGDVRSVFGDDAVAPGATLAGTLVVAAADLRDVCTVDAELDGTSRPGNLRVAAFFAMDPGSKARSRPLDERQAAAMAQLDDVLGDAGLVTLETIRQLEDEGKVPRGVLAPDPLAAPAPSRSAVRAGPPPGPAAEGGESPHRTAYR